MSQQLTKQNQKTVNLVVNPTNTNPAIIDIQVDAGNSQTINLSNIASVASSATSANTSGAIVVRDSSGNFSGGTITGTNLVDSGLTANRAVVSDSTKTLISSSTTDTELGYVHGVTSAIQTQLNTKLGSITGDATNSGTTVTVVSVGGSTAANIHTAELSANAATDANTPSTIVKRDASGNFTAGIITATLNGIADRTNALATPVTINGTPFDGSTNITVSASATNLTGTTLNSTVVNSSLTSVGTITSGTWSGTTIALNKGGTGQTTKSTAFDALSPMTTSGDIIYGGASGTGTRLAKGSDGQVLTLASGVPAWAAASSGSVSVAYIREEQPQNTGAGTFTAGTWLTRTLNTITDPNSIVTSLASNQFVLPAGTYKIEASAPAAGNANLHQARLRNITDSATTLTGTSEYVFSNAVATRSIVTGVFTIAGSKTFELQHYSNGGSPGVLGQVCNITTEVYSQVVITKI